MKKNVTYDINKGIGKHIILDFWFCKIDIEQTKSIFNRLKYFLERFNFNIVDYSYHKFEPQGFTGIFLISESHLSIHTYPECNYVSIDLYTCKIYFDEFVLINELIKMFKPKDFHIKTIIRGKKL